MKIAVLGAGAIGCFYGGLLARAGEDVTFIARGATLQYLQCHDLQVKSIWGDFALPVKTIASDNLDGGLDFDFVLLTIKSTALKGTIPELKKVVGERTKIVCLLNGIGNEEQLAAVFGAERVIGGSAFISVIREAPGVVNHVGEGSVTIGHWHEGNAEAESRNSGVPQVSIENLADAIKQSGIKVIVTDDIRQVKWEKLLWNIVFNPVTALTRTTVGETLDNPDLRTLLNRIKDEFLATAQAAGVPIHPEMVDVVFHPDSSVRNHKTSMLQDLENGRKMELDAILGFAVQEADRYHVPARTIETIYHLLRFEESRTAAANLLNK